jgi:hypothetical protein
MKILFISPWSALDPLALSTVDPNLNQLAHDNRVSQIIYVSTEVEVESLFRQNTPSFKSSKILHIPIKATRSYSLIGQIKSFIAFKASLIDIYRSYCPSLVICRGTTSQYGALLKRKFGVEFVVESFEPHANYMLQSGAWSRFNPKFIVQKLWEFQAKVYASHLITVSYKFADYLKNSRFVNPSKISTVPCWVDPQRYFIESKLRRDVRTSLGITNQLIIIYVGKFGGLYSPLSSLSIFSALKRAMNRPLFFIVLTPQESRCIKTKLSELGLHSSEYYVSFASYDSVNAYLNAADVAISFWSPGPWSFACSPIKHAEYWACGLPLLMPYGIGDETDWLEDRELGIFYDSNTYHFSQESVSRLKDILNEERGRSRIRNTTLNLRSKSILDKVYQDFLDYFVTQRHFL